MSSPETETRFIRYKQRLSFPNMAENAPFCTENFKNCLIPARRRYYFCTRPLFIWKLRRCRQARIGSKSLTGNEPGEQEAAEDWVDEVVELVEPGRLAVRVPALVNGDHQRSDAHTQREDAVHYQVDWNEALHGTLVQVPHACNAFKATQPIRML